MQVANTMNKAEIKKKKKSPLTQTGDKTIIKRKHGPSKGLQSQNNNLPAKKKRMRSYNRKEEARLERIVFGDPSDIIDNLPEDDASGVLGVSGTNEPSRTTSNSEEEAEIASDTDTTTNDKNVPKAAWEDEDDNEYSVTDAFEAQHRRGGESRPEKLYSTLLQNKYKELVGTPKWAELDKTDPDTDDLDKEILKHSCHLEKAKLKNLPKSIIDIKALTPINKATHTEGPIVSSVEFHPTSTVALVGGASGVLSIFQVDGIENTKLHSIQFKKFPISSAKFLKEGTEILSGSQYYPHCFSYDLIGGKTFRIPLPHGITNMQKYEVSPDGKLLAVCGRMGEIYLLSSSSKELVGTLKMNARCRALAFTPDGRNLVTHGDCNEMYVWDLNSRICMHRAVDEGCITSTSIAISPSGQFLATGSKEGVVNLYDTNTVLEQKNPTPLKTVLNLVTSITELKFNPLSEILAIASNKKPNAFKMLHLPSFTIFSNFPTFQTNMVMPETVAFSPGSGYISISNRSGTAFLYRLKHYQSY